MNADLLQYGLLEFEPAFFPRVWGGQALRTQLSLSAPDAEPIGEAWLLADHPVHDSVVESGPWAGQSLHSLLARDAPALLGTIPTPTRDGRFPLMLKLLDCTDVLSVQVHPDDRLAEQLGEQDGGKTEMWYFLGAEAGAEIICGVDPECGPVKLEQASREGSISDCLTRLPVRPGDAVLVRAGTVHALGAGLLAAEIQQTSDVTYRLFDWNRMGMDGKPRVLHIDQAMACIALNTPFHGLARPMMRKAKGAQRELLAACEFFATERVTTEGTRHDCDTGARSFRILLGLTGESAVSCAGTQAILAPGRAIVVAGSQPAYTLEGCGTLLDHYVPHPDIDVRFPLLEAGYSLEEIAVFLRR